MMYYCVSGARVSTLYCYIAVHLGLNVTISTHNCRCMVKGCNTMVAILSIIITANCVFIYISHSRLLYKNFRKLRLYRWHVSYSQTQNQIYIYIYIHCMYLYIHCIAPIKIVQSIPIGITIAFYTPLKPLDVGKYV